MRAVKITPQNSSSEKSPRLKRRTHRRFVVSALESTILEGCPFLSCIVVDQPSNGQLLDFAVGGAEEEKYNSLGGVLRWPVALVVALPVSITVYDVYVM